VNDERLWAPWRLEYVSGAQHERQELPPSPTAWQPGADEKCFLCRAAAQYDDPTDVDRQLLVAARDTFTMIVLNRYPYSNGHLMIAPRRHVAQLADLSPDEHLASMIWLSRMTGILGDVLRAEGFNIGLNLGRVAGAGCPGHLHWHIVPRWAGDSNFMTVLAGTRVIPQSLDALWELLTKTLQTASPKSQ
jgi:ATP adenylyltransferase